MPFYPVECKKCKKQYEVYSGTMSGRDKAIESAKCEECGSKAKTKLVSCCNFKFSNPIGTDRWASDSMGHDYRHNWNMENRVNPQRKQAEELSHMGPNPYPEIDDVSSGEHFGEVK